MMKSLMVNWRSIEPSSPDDQMVEQAVSTIKEKIPTRAKILYPEFLNRFSSCVIFPCFGLPSVRLMSIPDVLEPGFLNRVDVVYQI